MPGNASPLPLYCFAEVYRCLLLASRGSTTMNPLIRSGTAVRTFLFSIHTPSIQLFIDQRYFPCLLLGSATAIGQEISLQIRLLLTGDLPKGTVLYSLNLKEGRKILMFWGARMSHMVLVEDSWPILEIWEIVKGGAIDF